MSSEVRSKRSHHRQRACCFVLSGLFAMPLCAQTLRVYHIDVDQGDATLLVAPAGKTLLVDSGSNRHADRIRAVMEQAGVDRIDFFVTTHYHADHYGGIDRLAAMGVEIGTAYDRGDKEYLPPEKRASAAFQEYQSTVGDRALPLTRGMTIPLDPDMTVTCISSGGVVLGEENPRPGFTEDDMSLSLLVTLGSFRYFLLGDIQDPTQEKIAAHSLVGAVDVVQAGFHDLQGGSPPALLKVLQPGVLVLSGGKPIPPGRLALPPPDEGPANPPRVFQTHGEGSGSDAPLEGSGGTVLVTVDPGSGVYTVARGAGRSLSFPFRPTLPHPSDLARLPFAAHPRGPALASVTPVRAAESEPEVALETELRPEAAAADEAEEPASRVQTEPFDSPPEETSALAAGLLLLACLGAGTAGYLWARVRRGQEGEAEELLSVTSGREEASGASEKADRPTSEEVTASPAPPGRSLRWERFPDSTSLNGAGRHTWVRRQPGSLRSRQGSINVDFGEDVDFLVNVPFAIDHELCLSVAEMSPKNGHGMDPGRETVGVYNRGAALAAALGNCSDAERAVLLKAERDDWLQELNSAVRTRFSSGTVCLFQSIEAGNLRERTEKTLDRLLKLMQGAPRVRNAQSTPIHLQSGALLDPGAEAFRDSFTDFELEQLLDVGALEECRPLARHLPAGS